MTTKMCMLCKSNSDDLKKYSCGEHVCQACLDNFEATNVKKFKCKKCSSNHMVNARGGTASATVPKIQGSGSIQKTAVAQSTRAHKDVITSLSKSEVEAIAFIKEIKPQGTSKIQPTAMASSQANCEPFNYERCWNQDKSKIVAQSKISVAHLKSPTMKNLMALPMCDDQIVVCNNEKFFLMQLPTGKIVHEQDIKRPGVCVDFCVNDKYIYLVNSVENNKKCLLSQFDQKFKFLKELKFDSPCFSLTCSDTKVYITGTQGSEYNPNTIIHVIDATTLKVTDKIMEDSPHLTNKNKKAKYTCPKNSNPPRVAYFNSHLFVCYDDYCQNQHVISTENNRIDVVSEKHLTLKSSLKIPAWFMRFEFDAAGQFINYDFAKQVFGVYAQANAKLLKELQLEEFLRENSSMIFFCTNAGHLCILRDNEQLEIY